MKKFLFLLICVATSCGKPLPSFDGIDIAQWKDDKNGCTHYRDKTVEQLSSQREKIKGLSESEILKLLGKPDQTELYKRNQKFFYYFIEPSAKCDSTKTNARKLSIRFNAMEMAKDVVVE